MAASRTTLPEIVLVLVVAVSFCHASHFQFAVLDAKNEKMQEKSACLGYSTKMTSFPRENGAYMPLVDLSEKWSGCNGSLIEETASVSIKGHIVMVNQAENCSIYERAKSVMRFGGKGMIMVLSAKIGLKSEDPSVIPIAFILPWGKQSLKELGSNVDAVIHSPKLGFSYSWIAIFTFSVLAVGIGASWKQQNVMQEILLEVSKTQISTFLLLSCVTALIAITAGFMALLVYLFISYPDFAIYVVIGTFVFGSILAFYFCLEKIFDRIPIGILKFGKIQVHLNKIMLFIASLTLVTCWTIYRKESFAWILLDIVSFTTSIALIRIARFPSLKFGTIFLAMLFIFEIVLIYVTPLFTSNGNSSNGSSGSSSTSAALTTLMIKELPMFIRFPFMGYDPLSVCRTEQQYTLLGLENIFFPGMLVGFCYSFDVSRSKGPKIYFATALIAYALGLLLSIAFLTATPALIHFILVLFALPPIFIVGLCRREMKLLWRGGEQEKLPIVEKKLPSFLAPPKLSN